MLELELQECSGTINYSYQVCGFAFGCSKFTLSLQMDGSSMWKTSQQSEVHLPQCKHPAVKPCPSLVTALQCLRREATCQRQIKQIVHGQCLTL